MACRFEPAYAPSSQAPVSCRCGAAGAYDRRSRAGTSDVWHCGGGGRGLLHHDERECLGRSDARGISPCSGTGEGQFQRTQPVEEDHSDTFSDVEVKLFNRLVKAVEWEPPIPKLPIPDELGVLRSDSDGRQQGRTEETLSRGMSLIASTNYGKAGPTARRRYHRRKRGWAGQPLLLHRRDRPARRRANAGPPA